MDESPSSAPRAPRNKKALITIVSLSVIIIGLIIAFIWCWFYWPHGDKGGTAETSPPTETAATGPCAEGAENVAPAGFVFYENASLGYRFAYPSAWGAVNVTTTPIASETGNYVQGSFASNENVVFGGNAVDYTVSAREGIPTDLPGYLEAAGQFYQVELWKFSDGTTTEERDDLRKFDPPYEQKAGCNAEALVTHQEASDVLGTPAVDIARFNLQPDNAHYGVNFALSSPDDALRAQLDQLIATFELLD
jgi:hypothetical protein